MLQGASSGKQSFSSLPEQVLRDMCETGWCLLTSPDEPGMLSLLYHLLMLLMVKQNEELGWKHGLFPSF